MYSKLIETMKKLMPEKKLSRDEALQAIRNAGWEVETVCPHCKIEYADHCRMKCSHFIPFSSGPRQHNVNAPLFHR